MSVRASIDLGTNTCLLLIAELPSGRPVREARPLEDHSTVVRLGEGVDASRALQPEPIERALRCLRGYAERVQARGIKPKDVCAVATAQARGATNGAEFFARVERETGFVFKVISGDQEARLAFEGGLLPGMDPASAAIIDIGGGSTEIVSEEGGKSIDMGSVRLSERFFARSLRESDTPVTDAEFWACQEAIDALLDAQAPAQVRGLSLVGVAGTVITIAQWQLGLAAFDAAKLDGLELTRGDVHRAVEEFKWRSAQERRAIAGMEPKRADVILAGTLILWRAMEKLGFASLRVSTRGLRYGALGLSPGA